MVVKKVVSPTNLTKTETEILHLLLNEYLSPKKIAIRRGVSQQAVSKVIVKLKEKGALKQSFQRVVDFQPTLTTKNNQIRLHGQEFNIKIIYKDQRYKNILNKCNLINVDGNQIKLYNDSVELYSGKSFFADDVQKATSKSFNYWNSLFIKLENRLKVVLIKPFKQNIRLVNAHYSEINNELSKDCNIKSEKIRCYTKEDGKLWFLIDNSFNLHEAECIHPRESKQDMEKVKAHFEDIREKDHIPLSRISEYMADTTKQINEISHGLNSIVDFLKLSIPNGKKDMEKPEYIR